MFSRLGSAAFKKDLTNIRILCERLGNPQHQFKSIHIAGTNGKGSVSHMLAAIFQTAGYKTGLYTSPHLYDFRERIRIDGIMVDESFVVEFVEKVKPAIEEIQPSFFEITVAMAFDYFARQHAAVAIIEVGLGGRLDSTNIITPELSIITNIGWDHMNMLGNSLEAIAFEKAGIIKKNIPVLIGEQQLETRPVFEKQAQEKKAEIFFAERFFEPKACSWNENQLTVSLNAVEKGKELKISTELTGIYQVKNLVTVLAAVELLDKKFSLSASVQEALKNVAGLTGLKGRWELIRKEPAVVLEVAHNKDGIGQMLKHLEHLDFDQLHLVFGMVRDKDISQVLQALPADAHYYFSQAAIQRALPARELKDKAAEYNLRGESFDDVNVALKAALARAGKRDLIIICGSMFLVAEVDRSIAELLQPV
jgi:dihydrofolate synthase / folylpolyglutamate synthase